MISRSYFSVGRYNYESPALPTATIQVYRFFFVRENNLFFLFCSNKFS